MGIGVGGGDYYDGESPTIIKQSFSDVIRHVIYGKRKDIHGQYYHFIQDQFSGSIRGGSSLVRRTALIHKYKEPYGEEFIVGYCYESGTIVIFEEE